MITVVSGQPRSGTSLTMMMLEAAGMKLWWNREPNRTPINPHGHFELVDDVWLPERVAETNNVADGKVIKVFPGMWQHLDPRRTQIIYIDRDPRDVAPSQNRMFLAEGQDLHSTPESVAAQRAEALKILEGFRHLIIQYEDSFTGVTAPQLCKFLGLPETLCPAMVARVDRTLYHSWRSNAAKTIDPCILRESTAGSDCKQRQAGTFTDDSAAGDLDTPRAQ